MPQRAEADRRYTTGGSSKVGGLAGGWEVEKRVVVGVGLANLVAG